MSKGEVIRGTTLIPDFKNLALNTLNAGFTDETTYLFIPSAPRLPSCFPVRFFTISICL